jgi:poly [ADP-ribose] polymerase
LETKNALYLVKVEPNANNNKYYRMIDNGNGTFTAQYGRIGVEKFQTATYSISQWNSKLNEKLSSKKGYIDQTRLVAETTVKAKKNKDYIDIESVSISQIVARLQAMAKQAIQDNYTISSNKVTQAMIDEAQITLNNLIQTSTLKDFNKVLVDLFQIIPRKMKKVADCLADSDKDYANILQREQDLLDVMRGQVIQQAIVEEEVEEDKPLSNQTILDAMGLRFEELVPADVVLIKQNLGSASNKYHQGWRVTNLRSQERFDKFIAENKIQNKKLLWHGSRNENWWSIVNTSLVLRPNAVISGKMFGYGIYFAPKAEKSLGYTSLSGSYWAGGNSNSAFMSLYDVAYGKAYDVHSFDSKYYDFNYEKLQQNCTGANCLHAHSGNGMLRNDEIIVYKEDQLTIKYLVELR